MATPSYTYGIVSDESLRSNGHMTTVLPSPVPPYTGPNISGTTNNSLPNLQQDSSFRSPSPPVSPYTVQSNDIQELAGTNIMNPTSTLRPRSTPSSVPPRLGSQSSRRTTMASEQPKNPIDVIKKNYRIDLVPELNQFRITGTCLGYKMYSDLVKYRYTKPYFSFGVKPGSDCPLIKKIVLTPQKNDLRLYTTPISVGFLRLQACIGYDWFKNTFGCTWRCKTKWTRGQKITKRFPIIDTEGFELTSFWNLKQNFPEFGGQVGQTSAAVKTNMGQFDLSVAKIKASIKL